ncbi:Uncharacterized membrane protein HdeD, DUF308 family [Faunimonas pinastri]|uniref:Uncharacterized membrane protein HdeD, DUF308 family n=1 Tax=Faunimonas pinastri TaxID=1855383 RepID=A0A1H9AE34_9HYPH|nr:HdeD family acid-resistance protein [Faunimonas pinastri]SEP75032.1 Uncharacterized membrane protein HdeD, DUF308 family [Faunimonas pinastri]
MLMPKLSPEHEHLRMRWGWFVALGLIMLIAGIVALGSVLVATVVSVLLVGWMMIFSGLAEIVHGMGMRNWNRFFFWVLIGVLYLLAGIFAVMNPLLASSVLTLLIAFGLIAAGIARIVLGTSMRRGSAWGWPVASGIITLLVGAMILFGWPASSLYTLGTFLGIDLIFTGLAWLALGIGLRGAARQEPVSRTRV